ncbi:hypothetical protein A7D27_26600 [Pseudomonas sp. 1D4]|uniref:T6SS effector BTH_I2691 family protein n=1 Tax=Pseudomonas sp. 1D4 TaxID=1843691 RepID=UPI00084AB30D|nr:T6SS effector BTH_I2691 family protein [Pseudomonas sp. 1D4]OEC35027.1 hypothetical protein A7D27_26600 [Pseudomonas sp. 1D4]
MTATAQNKQLQRAQRDQAFEQKPANASGQCPLKAQEFALFPVRYAIDESPPKGSRQGPNPLPATWPTRHLPALKTRSYTLRQLRDGWLYVWNETDKTLHEYQVKGYQFTRHKWTAAQLNRDTRHNPGETRPYLLYPKRSHLLIAYSPVQWTWRLCERMRSNPREQQRWMRSLDLSQYCTTLKASHAAPLRELGRTVADISTDGKSPAFQTCLVTAQLDKDPERACKLGLHEALVLGQVPDQDSALFVALDDPLGVVDDLALNLQGRWQELLTHELDHANSTHTATLVQELCGVSLDPFMPKEVAKNPQRRAAYIRDAHALLDRSADCLHDAGSDGTLGYKATALERESKSFRKTWGSLPSGEGWLQAVEHWHRKRLWRNDVRYEEASLFLDEKSQQAERLDAHRQRSEQDLQAWLERLSPRAEEVFYDPCHPEQATELLETMATLYSQLGASETGSTWLCKQYGRPTSLAGLALFNFSPELSSMVDRISENFIRYGTLDALGRQDDGSGKAHGGIADTTSEVSRLNEVKAVLDLPSVKRSQIYRALSEPVRAAFDTLRDVVEQKASQSWNTIAFTLLPALSERFAPNLRIFAFSVTQVLVSQEISTQTQLIKDPGYKKKHQSWQMKMQTLLKKMAGQQQVIARPGKGVDKRAAQVQLAQLHAQRQELELRRPHEVTGAIHTTTRLTQVNATEITYLLATLGQSELLDQLQLKARNAAAYAARAQKWFNRELGGSLPVLVAGLNVWNTLNSLENAKRDGIFTAAELRTVSANAAYTANALMALWTVPAWNKWAKLEGNIRGRTTQLAKAGVTSWASRNPGYATLARRLILRTMGMAAFGAIAAGVEAWQVHQDVGSATSQEEAVLLKMKLGALGGMALMSGVQLIGSGLGFWFGFAWVMSTPITLIVAVLGVLYLLVSLAANHFKREGLRRWLYLCSWGKAPRWDHSDDQHKHELNALSEICLRPSVVARATALPYYDRGPRTYTGFWVQVLVPAELAGHEVTLQPAMVAKDRLRQGTGPDFYQRFQAGHWAPVSAYGNPPSKPPQGALTTDTRYQAGDTHRLWQAWVSHPGKPELELEVIYPQQFLANLRGQGYLFRLAIDVEADEAELKSDPFDPTPVKGMALSRQCTYWLPLTVPYGS